ncbi:AraC family transcriptional regulator [Acidovorax sp. HDW3]|uniref:AraC family transcriptional regulator n=1 Tax=Acidovorax sp. HDW3 TaxID=2714923 RepID=UPI00140D880E|nr:AraC family transcriptional regulator [Acidovorax sp. HDW3]QIL44709.1 AraC family transcriptional regulator [Acidovorax sp. HDW3]
MALQATVSMSWVNTVLDAAAQQGAPRAQVLALAGIAPQELQSERWPIDHIARLWRAAVQATGDAGFGLKAGASVGPASFNVVSYLLQSAPTLRAALALVQQYQSLISDGGRFQTIAGEGACWVIYHPRQGSLAFSPHQIEAVLAAVVVFARWITGPGPALVPLAVQFNQLQIGPLAGYRAVFACPVQFEQAFSGLLWDNAVLDAPLPQADAQLAAAHHRLASARLDALAPPQALEKVLVQALQRWLQQQLHEGGAVPTRAQAAQMLGLGERTLARQLQAQATSFSQQLDAARRDAALQAVAQPERALADIGQALGYAEPAVFWRAFKRWTGCTPAQWRARQDVGS